MRRIPRMHWGFSLLELILLIGILAVILGTVMQIAISTEESRIRQHSIAEVEQRGTQLLETVTKTIRRAEAILTPAPNQTGSILALQMSLNGEFPTIVAATETGNLLLIQRTAIVSFLSSHVRTSHLVFRNVGSSNVVFSFDLSTTIPLVKPIGYARHFDATATLFPGEKSESGGCGSCPLPDCTQHLYRWYYCSADVCTQFPSTVSC